MTTDTLTGKLPVSKKIFYGVGDVGNAVINSSVQFFLLLFYTDAALVAPALAANALLVGKLWDGVNDPLFGWISDKVKSPLGRRRVFMIYGAVPLAVSVALLWFVPRGLSGALLFVWIAFTFMLWDTLWSVTNVPYYALTAELTDDYDERASLTTFRMAFAVPAFIVGAALTPAIVGMFPSKRLGYGVVGIAYGILAAAALLVCASKIKERPSVDTGSDATPFRAFAEALKNGPFVQLITAYGVCNLAFALTKTLLAYLLMYQFRMTDKVPLVMFLMLASVAAFLFPWKKLSEKMDKGPAYALGIAIGGLAVAITFFLPARPSPLVYAVAILAGIGFSANWVFPWAMVPDVIEFDRVKSGQQRSGIYYGLWGLAYKVSEGLGIVITGWVLQAFKYVPNAEQSTDTLLGIRLFVGPVPALLFFLSLPLLVWYPVTRKKHQEVCALLNERQRSEVPQPEPIVA